MLTYRRTDNLEIISYSDFDYVGYKDTKRSISSYVFMFYDGPIYWKSHKQSLVVSSTMDAEYIACYEVMCHEIWLRNFVSGLHVVDLIMRSLRIYCDNSDVVQFSKNTKTIKGSKRINIKYLAVREGVQNGIVCIEHIDNIFMLAYPLTKALPPKFFMDYVWRMAWWHLCQSRLIEWNVCDYIMKIKFLIFMFIMLLLGIDLVHNPNV